MRTLFAFALVATVASTADAQARRAAREEALPQRERVRTGVLQDPARVDTAHYKVEFEDSQMRILRVRLRAGEGSVMHEHPRGICIVSVTDAATRHLLPDSTTTETTHKAGDVTCNAATPGWYRHNPTNIGSADAEYLVIERKTPGYQRGLDPRKSPSKP